MSGYAHGGWIPVYGSEMHAVVHEPIRTAPASVRPATGPSAHYWLRADGTVESLFPPKRVPDLAEAERVVGALTGTSVSATFTAESMSNFMRAMLGDDADIHDEYLLYPDPPPAYLYR